MRDGRDLIHPRTRNAVRDYCSDFGTVRRIERVFESEGLPAHPDSSREWYIDGQRRGTFDRHTATVNWTEPADVRRVLDAFEQILTWGEEESWAAEPYARICRFLEKDGYTVDKSGRIEGGPVAAVLSSVPLETVEDPSAIYEHLRRLADVSDSDPATAISGAKALVEATTKVVLRELGVDYDERADVPSLVKDAQKALKLHPDELAPTATGVEIVKERSGLSRRLASFRRRSMNASHFECR